MGAGAEDLIERGRAALAAGDGAAAREAFEQALEARETGDVLVGLAEAVYLDADFRAASEAYERAFVAYRNEERPLDAARVARTLAYQYVLEGDWSLVNGWLARARRLVDDAGDDCVERHWIEIFDAMADPDPEARADRLQAVADAGRRLRDPNLEFDAVSVLGNLYVSSGRIAEGMALLDEALTAVCAGEVDEYTVVEGAFCLMLGACEAVQDVERAQRWTRAGDDISSRRGLASLGALCRGYYGGVLTASGRYAEAEAALTETIRGLEHGYALARSKAIARLAEVRLRQGRLEEAAQLLEGLEEHPDAASPLATLHLARGETALARDRIERAVELVEEAAAGRLLMLLVDVELTEGRTEAAQRVVERLSEMAEQQGSAPLLAATALARGRVCVATESSDATACLRAALAGFAEAGLPLELGRARLELAGAMAGERPEVAIAEAKAALDTFERLGAARWADAAGALLRELGAPVRVGPKGVGALTKREAEVLELLGHGLTNPEIAERLVISRKTVEHHVGRILLKLGLRNRAEAAAFATRTSGER